MNVTHLCIVFSTRKATGKHAIIPQSLKDWCFNRWTLCTSKGFRHSPLIFPPCNIVFIFLYLDVWFSFFVPLQSYRKRQAFLVTQLPLPDTVIDFWSLITDWEVHTVVQLLRPQDKKVSKYYTASGDYFEWFMFGSPMYQSQIVMTEFMKRSLHGYIAKA